MPNKNNALSNNTIAYICRLLTTLLSFHRSCMVLFTLKINCLPLWDVVLGNYITTL